MKLSDFSIEHPTVITIVLIVIIFFGIMSVTQLNQELIPETSQPSLLVGAVYPGAGAEDVENDVTSVIESAVTGITDVTSVSSISRESMSLVTINFDYGADLDMKYNDLRETIDNIISDLPDDLDGAPEIFRMSNGNMAVYTAAVESSWELTELTEYLDQRVLPRISRISGVAEASLKGGIERQLNITLDPDRINYYGISILDVLQIIQNNNSSVPGGEVSYRGTKMNIRTSGTFSSIGEIENLVVGFEDNSYIYLNEIADIYFTEKDNDVLVRSDGRDIVTINITKLHGANIINIVEETEKIFRETENSTSDAVRFSTVIDDSFNIEKSMDSVLQSGLYGGLLAVAILFIFLVNVRTTMIIAVSIPLSIIITFIALFAGDQTLNLMTLGGLTVGIGMIVDNSIVVLENIFKHFSGGMPPKEAASKGAAEVSGAIIASTSTSLCVFIPLLFVEGLVGQILKPTAFAITAALAASLVVAVFVVPYLAALLLKNDKTRSAFLTKAGRLVDINFNRLSDGFASVLKWSLGHTLYIMLFAAVILAITFVSFSLLGSEFIPSTDMNEVQLYIECPTYYSLEETRDKADEIDAFIRDVFPEIETGVIYVGQESSLVLLKNRTKAFARYRLVPSDLREKDSREIVAQLQQLLPESITDASFTVANGGLDATTGQASSDLGSTANQGFTIKLSGTNLDELAESASMVMRIMDNDPAVVQTVSGAASTDNELTIQLDHEAVSNAGLSAKEAAVTGRVIFYGMEAGSFDSSPEDIPIMLNSRLTSSAIPEDVLNRIMLKNPADEFVSLSTIASLSKGPSIREIKGSDGMRTIEVTGILNTDDLREVEQRIVPAVDSIKLPAGIEWTVSGQAEEMQSSFAALFQALMIAVFLVYSVMVIQFEKFHQPLMVMGAIPFTLIGVIAILVIMDTNLSVVAILGIIALFGIVVNNAIVMIDYMNLLRTDYSMPLFEAVIKGASSRLRPILMTTFTTLLGVMPLALRAGQGSEIYSPLGKTIFGGLITSSLITLIIIPVIYYRVELSLETRRKNNEEKILQLN